MSPDNILEKKSQEVEKKLSISIDDEKSDLTVNAKENNTSKIHLSCIIKAPVRGHQFYHKQISHTTPMVVDEESDIT